METLLGTERKDLNDAPISREWKEAFASLLVEVERERDSWRERAIEAESRLSSSESP